LSVNSSGDEVGAFTALADIPPPIQILSQFPPGMSVSSSVVNPFTVTWSGGDNRSFVTVDERIYTAGSEQVGLIANTVRADARSTSLGSPAFSGLNLPSAKASASGSEVRISSRSRLRKRRPERLRQDCSARLVLRSAAS
jgi:hypothetical protein